MRCEMQPNFFLVEFAGLPGAGKSTISRRVAELLRQRGIRVEEVHEILPSQSRAFLHAKKLAYVMKEVLGRPRSCYLAVRAIFATRQRSIVDMVMVLYNWLFTSALMNETDGTGGVRLFDLGLLDEGMFQALWSIGYSARAEALPSSLTAFPRLMPRPDLVVLVEASLPTVKRRLAARSDGRSRLDRVKVSDHRVFLRAAEVWARVKDKIARVSSQYGSIRVVLVDNDQDTGVEETAAKLATYIHTLYETADAAGADRGYPGMDGRA